MIQILLCTYNGAEYLETQLNSILEQSEQDFRVLISDDGSRDGTAELAEALVRKAPGKLEFRRQSRPSGGACRHFLKLLTEEECVREADYVMLSDQDDRWHPDKIEKTLAHMKRLEEEYGAETPLLVHCDSVVTDAELRMISPSYTAYQQMTPSRCRFHQLLIQNNVTGGAMMMNRALAAKLDRMPEHAVMHDQWAALVAAAFGQVSYLDEALYDYRQHGGNVLGADKGSRIREILNRLGIGRSDGKSREEVDAVSKSVYRDLFLQAESFLKLYGDELSPEKKKKLQAMIGLQKQGRIGKIITILRYGLTYNKLHRTVGECIFI